MRSIIQDEKKCFICGNPYNLEAHHIFNGPNRKLSEKYGLKIWLCKPHHTGDKGVHFDEDLKRQIKQLGQTVFEAEYGSREDFLRIFGKNYLGDEI